MFMPGSYQVGGRGRIGGDQLMDKHYVVLSVDTDDECIRGQGDRHHIEGAPSRCFCIVASTGEREGGESSPDGLSPGQSPPNCSHDDPAVNDHRKWKFAGAK